MVLRCARASLARGAPLKWKDEKKKSKASRERGCLQFPNLLPCTSCRDFLWYLNELLASNKMRGDWRFRSFSHQPIGDTHDERRDKKTKPDNRNIFTPWHYLHSLNKLLVKAIRTKREWQSPILWVWIKSIFLSIPFSLKKVSKKLQDTANKVPT